jgi:hypothetical protein
MLSLINNYNYDFRELKFSEARELKKTSVESPENLAHSLSTLKRDSSSTVYQITHLNMTVTAYLKEHSQMSLLRKIFNIFTTYKARALQKHLPNLINAVANTRLEEDLKGEGQIIQEKISLLGRVQAELAKKWRFSKTAKQVNAYFQYKMMCLEQGLNVALPFPSYYHCTKKEHFDSLVQSKKIKQTNAMCGFGAYISTNIEHHSYGPYAFAIEGRAVESLRATYRIGLDCHDPRPFESVWMRVENDIPVNWKTVAHITVGSLSKCSTMVTRIKRLGFFCPVLTREASYKIDDLFQTIVPRRQFTAQWTNPNQLYCKMPNNIKEYQAA